MVVKEPTIKNFADYFVIGLQLDVCSQSEIITWVDRSIKETDHPPYWMMYLSTSSKKISRDIFNILNSVPGTVDIDISLRLLIAKLSLQKPVLFAENNHFITPQDSQLFTNLYFLTKKYNDISDNIKNYIFDIYTGMDDVDSGYLSWSSFQQDYQNLLSIGKNYQNFI